MIAQVIVIEESALPEEAVMAKFGVAYTLCALFDDRWMWTLPSSSMDGTAGSQERPRNNLQVTRSNRLRRFRC